VAAVKIIPAIDLQDGKCVRLWQGDFEKTTEYSVDPTEVATQFAQLNATDLHLVDLDGARYGKQLNQSIVASIVEQTAMTVQLGGGIRDADTLTAWFAAGVSRCVIGSLAVTEPDTVKAWISRFGGENIVLALDVKLDDSDEPIVTTHGWTRSSNLSLFECINDFRSVGLVHVLCTDVSRDGAMAGPNVELYQRILAEHPAIALQASGGVRDISDLQTLRDIGVPAAISGRALLDGKITAEEIAKFLQNA
jgi:phosphoribosylformimino-5-aminoimidazole carboxamide ribotide isomerase